MVTLHCVGGVDDPPDFVGELEEACQLRPVFIPGFQDVGLLPVPLFPELLFGVLSIFQIDRAVNLFQIRAHGFSVLVGDKFAAVAYLVDDAKLIFRLRKNGVDGLGKSCQIVVTSDENIRNAPIFQV